MAQSDNGGPFGAILDRDSTAAYESIVTYDRPQPPEGWPEEEEWYPEDDGLAFTVVDYLRTFDEHGFNTDGSPVELASGYSELSREWDRQTSDTYAGNNEFSTTTTLTTTGTPFPTEQPPSTYTETTTTPGARSLSPAK